MRPACVIGLLPGCGAVKGTVIPHATGMTLGQLAGVAQHAVRNRLDSGSGREADRHRRGGELRPGTPILMIDPETCSLILHLYS
jgi:hypothetical protein